MEFTYTIFACLIAHFIRDGIYALFNLNKHRRQYNISKRNKDTDNMYQYLNNIKEEREEKIKEEGLSDKEIGLK